MTVANDGASGSRGVAYPGVTRRDLLRRGGTLAGAGVLGSALLAACGSSSSPVATGKGRNTLTWAVDTDPIYLIPIGANATATWVVTSLMYESLLQWDKNLKVQPALAESWEAPDGRTFIFHLRKDAKFHSGKPLDAEDVKYSMEKQANPPPPGVNLGFYPAIASVDVLDKHTVRFRMSRTSPDLYGYLAWNRTSAIVPAGFYESHNARTQVDGTGPFKLGEYVSNDHVTLLKNENYWSPGLPKLDQITLKILTDEGARFDALRAGQIDGGPFSSDTARVARSAGSFQVQRGLTAAPNELEITLKDPSKPWFDVRVRRAISLAIDRQQIIQTVFGGQAVLAGKIPPGYGDWPISNSLLQSKYEVYDPRQAKALLKAAGHGGGFELPMNSIAQPVAYTKVAEAIASQLKQVGISVTVNPEQIATFAAQDGAGRYEWESTGRGMRGDPSFFFSDFTPGNSLYSAWFGSEFERAVPSARQIQQLAAEGLGTLNDQRRHQIYQQLEGLILTDWPEMPLVESYVFQILSQNVHGMYLSYTTGLPGLASATVS